MAISFPVMLDKEKKIEVEYANLLDSMDLNMLVREFFSYLDYREESDSGRVFPPIYISSCRVLMTPALDMVLQRMRKKVE